MKKIITLLCVIMLGTSSAFANDGFEIKFNEGVELMGVVFRLAGMQEFQYNQAPTYMGCVDTYFSPYKDHPVTDYVRLCRKEAHVAYDAVAAYGQHLVISPDGTISLDHREVEGTDTSLDRWPKEMQENMLTQLNAFYKDSDFHTWYTSVADYQQKAIEQFTKQVEKIDFAWFDDYFYGNTRSTEKSIVLSVIIGPNNFGNSMRLKDGGEVICPTMGSCREDENGNPTYRGIAGIIVHEFCHHYCNPLNEKHFSSMSKGTKNAFMPMKDRLTASAYPSPQIMQNETFVRSSVIRYTMSHSNTSNIDVAIAEEQENGFLLTRTEVETLEAYEAARDKYKTMEDFMPILCQSIDAFTMAKYKQRLKEVSPDYATYKCNIKNGAKNIPAGEKRIELAFSKPMQGGVSLNMLENGTDFPPLKEVSWSDDMKTLYIDVNLESGMEYGFRVVGSGFLTQDGNILLADDNIAFKVK